MGWFTPRPPQVEQERQELRELFDRVIAQHSFSASDIERLVGAFFEVLDYELSEPMKRALSEILSREQYFGAPPVFDRLDFRQIRDVRTRLRQWEQRGERGQDLAQDLMLSFFTTVAKQLPRTKQPSPFTIPLIYALDQPKTLISSLYKSLFDAQYLELDLFTELRTQMYLNLCAASSITPYTEPKKSFKHAVASELPLMQLNDTYLKGTPIHKLFLAPVPLKLTIHDRFSHMHIVGGSGAGKTTLLEHLILHDLESDDPPSLIIVDSQGDLIRKVAHLDGIADRLILIDPRDVSHPPALNIFDVNRSRTASYDESTREQVTAGVIQTFDYLFAGLLGADLTAKQGVFFKFVARLMLSLPESLGRNATILDMMNLMEDAKPYKMAIDALPPIPRSFFEKDFNQPVFRQTKEQIRYRLQAIIENPTMARLFTAPETKVDLFHEMNRGSVILVDTAKDFLKGASANYGRIFISLVLQAVLERAAIPEHERKPVFLIVDEAASYFDSNIDDLLTEARKYKCGIVLAHQYLDQTSYSLRASLAANTSIKFATGVSNSDARAMSADMRTTPEFILDQPRLHFAAHIRNVTPQAVSIPLAPGRLAKQPQLSNHSFEEFRQRNRERVALTKAAENIDISSAAQVPDEDVSDKW